MSESSKFYIGAACAGIVGTCANDVFEWPRWYGLVATVVMITALWFATRQGRRAAPSA